MQITYCHLQRKVNMALSDYMCIIYLFIYAATIMESLSAIVIIFFFFYLNVTLNKIQMKYFLSLEKPVGDEQIDLIAHECLKIEPRS